MNVLIEILNGPVLRVVIFITEVLTTIMVLRSAYIAYILFKDYKERSSRSFGYFFVGLAIGASRALTLIPLTEPPLWNILWQAVSYTFIVVGLEMIYAEINDGSK